jgi:hypothetical protein
MTLGFRGYTVENASTPPNRTRVNTLPWTIQWHYVARNFVIIYSFLGSLATCKTCTCPLMIAMHLNQHNFTYKIHTIMFLVRCSRHQPFIIIILWIFHSLLTCRLVYNTNPYISMHYHRVNLFNHNLNLVSTYQQL